jgi:hypothetical protein
MFRLLLWPLSRGVSFSSRRPAKVRASRFEDVFEVRARDTRTNGGSSPPCGVPRYREMTSSTLLSPICTDGRVIGERG